jgi:hypothetical protein
MVNDKTGAPGGYSGQGQEKDKKNGFHGCTPVGFFAYCLCKKYTGAQGDASVEGCPFWVCRLLENLA